MPADRGMNDQWQRLGRRHGNERPISQEQEADTNSRIERADLAVLKAVAIIWPVYDEGALLGSSCFSLREVDLVSSNLQDGNEASKVCRSFRNTPGSRQQ